MSSDQGEDGQVDIIRENALSKLSSNSKQGFFTFVAESPMITMLVMAIDWIGKEKHKKPHLA